MVDFEGGASWVSHGNEGELFVPPETQTAAVSCGYPKLQMQRRRCNQ
jgi:hypothetical protein